MLVEQIDKVDILRHDHDASVASRPEDFWVRGAVELQVTDGNALNRICGPHPRGEGRRELIVEPEGHAATMG